MSKVYEKLIAVQSKLKVHKGQRNTFGNYNYRSCEDILEALKPILAENNASTILKDELVLIGERYYLKATAVFIDCESGEVVETVAYAREDETKKGMDLAQITGSVSSYARKYALNGLFCIDDTKDSDATNTHDKDENKDKDEVKKAVSEAQVKRLYALGKQAGYEAGKVLELVKEKCNVDDPNDLSTANYNMLCKGFEKIIEANKK